VSTYLRESGVAAVRIRTYPKRRRPSSATLERRPDPRPRRTAPAGPLVAEPAYADFFHDPSAVSDVA
jgi:hypothetical protein